MREGFEEPPFKFHIVQTVAQVHTWLDKLQSVPVTYVDIEGSLDLGGVTCIGFSLSPTEGFTIPFHDLEGNNLFNPSEEVEIWDRVQEVLHTCQTGWQNYLYDSMVLAYGYGITIARPVEDTMFKTWELFCEFPKSLGFQTSFYTDHPYYKNERTAQTLKEQLEYNIKDCCITHECSEEQEKVLAKDPLALQNYHNNIHRLPILLYMQLQGINFDKDEKARLKTKLIAEIRELQSEVDQDWIQTKGGQKATQDYEDEVTKVEAQMEHYRSRLEVTRGEIAERESNGKPLTKKLQNDLLVCERQLREVLPKRRRRIAKPSLNAKSSAAKAQYLYTKGGLGLKKPPRAPTESACDELSLIKVTVDKKTPLEVKPKVQTLLKLIKKRTQLQDVRKLRVDPLDGRIRCSYGGPTDTGRWTCRESIVPANGYKI
jgi:hypothetical protein